MYENNNYKKYYENITQIIELKLTKSFNQLRLYSLQFWKV